jgi:hypothetical protein
MQQNDRNAQFEVVRWIVISKIFCHKVASNCFNQSVDTLHDVRCNFLLHRQVGHKGMLNSKRICSSNRSTKRLFLFLVQ